MLRFMQGGAGDIAFIGTRQRTTHAILDGQPFWDELQYTWMARVGEIPVGGHWTI